MNDRQLHLLYKIFDLNFYFLPESDCIHQISTNKLLGNVKKKKKKKIGPGSVFNGLEPITSSIKNTSKK